MSKRKKRGRSRWWRKMLKEKKRRARFHKAIISNAVRIGASIIKGKGMPRITPERFKELLEGKPIPI